MAVPGIVVKNHGPFAWGTKSIKRCLQRVVLEKVCGNGFKDTGVKSTGRDEAICVRQAL